VLTHKPSVAAYRAPVAPQTIFAIESHMEQIARTLASIPSSSAAATSSRKATRW
jgi:CO/xanthine dehydrogenase Mo-binding subunit